MTLPQAKAGAAAKMVVAAWLITSLFYFYQYALRVIPSTMAPDLEAALGLSAAGLAALLGVFYYAYAPFSLVAGVAMDRLGPRRAVPLGAAVMALGALLFAVGDPTVATIARFLLGAGAVFSLIGAAYIASTYFPASQAATLIGATQMIGMAGGTAGSFVAGPALAAGLDWRQLWAILGVGGFVLAALLIALIPRRTSTPRTREEGGQLRATARAMAASFANPQTILCGLVAGLMFIPTTIFDMVWGVRFLQEGHDLPYAEAVMRSATVPFGWMIGCPLLGWLSDRLGRRRPVILGSAVALLAVLALILHGPPGLFPAFSLGLLAGVASGGVMLTYTVVKEANRPEHAGTATGALNFINFGLSAVLSPVFAGLLQRASGGGARELGHYQATFEPMLAGVALAVVLALFLRETGPGRRTVPASTAAAAGSA